MTGTLTASAASVEQGEPIVFTFATTQVTPKNWVGLYSDPGNGPVNQVYVGPLTTYEYATTATGSVSFGSGALSAGNYIAFYLFNDGYTWLADPVKFSVRPTPQADPPVYRNAFGRNGCGPGQLANPAGLTVDRNGLVWVADSGNDRVQAFTRDGLPVRMLAGRLRDPQAVAVDNTGNVFVADTGNNRVAKFAWWGGFVGDLGGGLLDNPRGIAVDNAGHVFVSDTGNQRVARFDANSGKLLNSITDGMSSPQGLTVDGAGNLWVVQNGIRDSGRTAVIQYSAAGTVARSIGYGQSSKFGGLSNPSDVAVDTAGNAYVTVPDYGWVAQFRTVGPFRAQFGAEGQGALRFAQGVALDRQGRIFVADTGNSRIVQFGAQR